MALIFFGFVLGNRFIQQSSGYSYLFSTQKLEAEVFWATGFSCVGGKTRMCIAGVEVRVTNVV